MLIHKSSTLCVSSLPLDCLPVKWYYEYFNTQRYNRLLEQSLACAFCHVKLRTFSHGATAPGGPGRPRCWGFEIILRHTTLDRTLLDELSARRRDLYLTIHNTHNRQTFMLPVGFKTQKPSMRGAAEPCLRTRGHWDRRGQNLIALLRIPLHSARSI